MVIEDEEALDKLIRLKLLRPIGKNEYLFCPADGIEITIASASYNDIPDNIESKNSITKDNKKIKIKQLNEEFMSFIKDFPTTDAHNGFPKSRDLKKDSGNTAFTRYRTLREDYQFEAEDILNAMKYEKYWRIKQSLATNENLLKYMRGLSAWLNDKINIMTQLEQMQHDDSYSPNSDPSQDVFNNNVDEV